MAIVPTRPPGLAPAPTGSVPTSTPAKQQPATQQHIPSQPAQGAQRGETPTSEFSKYPPQYPTQAAASAAQRVPRPLQVPDPGIIHRYPRQYQLEPPPKGPSFPNPKPETVDPTAAFKRFPRDPKVASVTVRGQPNGPPYPAPNPKPPLAPDSPNEIPLQIRTL